MRTPRAFKPYYLVHAYSPKKRRLVPQYNPNELAPGRELMSLKEATRRSIEFAASLNENNHCFTKDWIPKVQFITDDSKIMIDLPVKASI